MILYYVTDRMHFPGRERERCKRLLARIAEAARKGIDFVQLREKDLAACELESLAREAAENIRASGEATRLLINSRSDVALAAGAGGVHLRSKDISPVEVAKIWREAKVPQKPVIAVSCHSRSEVEAAEATGADFVVFGPVFEKKASAGRPIAGLELLRSVCKGKVPVLALGGITLQNAAQCIDAGAAGIAGIRLFQEGNLAASISALRG